MNGAIDLSRLHFPVTTLGPGRRIGIWFQGCTIRCPGCISLDTWTKGRGTTTVGRVMEAVAPWIASADGITVSGGEPWDQRDALFELLGAIRARTDADILVYTGYRWADISETSAELPFLMDAIVTGPFEIETRQSLALRGSDNQELRMLTPLGRSRFESFERSANRTDRSFDIMFGDGGDVWLAGIPGRGDFRRLRDVLEKAGTTLGISEDPRFPLNQIER